MKYSEIKSLEDLERAQADVREKLKRKEKELGQGYDNVRSAFTPTSLLSTGVRAVARSTSADRFLLNLVRKAIKRLK